MRRNERINPPRLAQRLLLWFLRPELAEEVMGDLEEKFYDRLKTQPARRVVRTYWWETLNYLRPFAFRKSKSNTINQPGMIRNYLTIGWRSLAKNKMYSAIKIGGFSMGIAACLLIALFIFDELSYDQFYPNGDRIYRVVEAYNDNGEVSRGVWFQAPFAKSVKDDYPEIELAGRYNAGELFGAGSKEIRPADRMDNTHEEGFVFFDQELLSLLQLPMIYGNPEKALSEPRTLVITRRKAEKYFPNENPVGKLMIVNNNEKEPFKIGGVIEDFPETSHLQYDFLMTLTGVEFWPGEQNYWGANNYPTYLLLKPGADAAQLSKKMDAVLEKYLLPLLEEQGQANVRELIKNASYELQPVRNIHLRSAGIQDVVQHGDIRFVWLFGGIALFILLIAIINFVNLSTARSANRAKEVGLRKTVGSFRSHIINQFLTESILFSLFSFTVGVLLAWLLLPYFNVLAAKSIAFPWQAWQLFPLLIISAIVVGLLAGAYPSFYLSSFKPIHVLKGNLSKGSKSSGMRSALVIFQFTTSIILIIATFVIYRQMDFILNKDVGYSKDQVIIIQGTNTLDKQLQSFKDELLQITSVKSATVSDYLPIKGTKRNGNTFWNEGKQKEDQGVGGQFWRVDHDYAKTLGMKIIEGRDFSREMASDSDAVVINQAMARELGLKDPINKRITNRRMTFNVIGVVQDFNFETLHSKVQPLCLVLGQNSNQISTKVSSSDMAGTLKAIESLWHKFSPHQPIRYAFLDERFARMYDDILRMGRIFTTFAVLAIFVASLGLFALSAFMVEQRSKEISIRLVLGASMKSIFGLLTRNFLVLVLIAFVLAVPIGWYLMQQWLQDYAFRIDITWDVFIVAGSLAGSIALLTISYQSVKAALMKPANVLKSE